MNLLDIVHRTRPPAPWQEGDNIPWNDPAFSRRMLREHLSQEHDGASRRLRVVKGHVAWIHDQLLRRRPGRVLDLGCGPGLYTHRLAARGHTCTGIDFSPAAIAHARDEAEREGLPATYVEGDLRTTPYGRDRDLVMLIFGEFNVFRPDDARAILRRAREALAPGGRLLIEPLTEDGIRAMAENGQEWGAAPGGLWSDRPHLWLSEAHWDKESRTCTTRYYVIDAGSAAAERYAVTYQAYSLAEYDQLLQEAGFAETAFLEGLGGAPAAEGFMAVMAWAP